MKLKIAYCGPISLRLLEDLVVDGVSLPEGYTYPLGGYLVRQYLDRGHEVAVITSANGVPSHKSWYGENVSIHVSPRRRARFFLKDFYGQERASMVKDIRVSKPHIVHAQWTYEFAHAAIASGFPTAVTARDVPWRIFRNSYSFYRLYRALYSHFVVPKIRNLHAVSDYLAQAFQNTYRKDAIQIIPNGMSKKLFNCESRRIYKGDKLNFITISGWDPWKNVKDLILAFSRIRKERENASLVLIGTGLGENGPAWEWAKRRSLTAGIQFLGRLPHCSAIEALKRQGNVFVNTTLEESFCMTVLEAMGQGLPVIAYPDSGAVPWLLDNGKAGILAEKQNWRSFADAMFSAVGDLDHLNAIAKRGYERAKECFSLERVADLYIETFERMLKK